jgi:hypothetical protein
MSSRLDAPSQRRTSERRRLKLLRNSNEYRVPNPFRQQHAMPVPDTLFKQLARMEFLSTSTIKLLTFDPNTAHLDSGEGMLARMHEAVQLQELRYSALIGPSSPPVPQDEGLEDEGKAMAEAEEVVQTKDEISRNIYDPRDPRGEEEFACEVLLCEEAETPAGRVCGGEGAGGAAPLGEEEY